MHRHREVESEGESGHELAAGQTVRFGISTDARLLGMFDEMIARKGYANRSEAIRDLMRDELVESAWASDDEDVIGTVTIVYDHDSRELTHRLTHLQHEHRVHIISALHVHLDEHSCLEVMVIRGKGSEVKDLSDRLIGTRGVKHGKLAMSSTGQRLF